MTHADDRAPLDLAEARTSTILVTISEGIAEVDISTIPPGIAVEVRDYDTENAILCPEAGGQCERPDFHDGEHGAAVDDEHWTNVYTGPPADTDPLAALDRADVGAAIMALRHTARAAILRANRRGLPSMANGAGALLMVADALAEGLIDRHD